MNLQVIHDVQGNDVGVFIPMDDWNKIKLNYPDLDSLPDEIISYTTSGQPLSKKQYQKLVNEGISQCRVGKYVTLEQLSEKLGYDYADL